MTDLIPAGWVRCDYCSGDGEGDHGPCPDCEGEGIVYVGHPPLLRALQLRTTNTPIDSLVDRVRRGQLLLDPPYQRGAVWGKERKVNLIRSVTMGLPIGAIYINDRRYPDEPVVIDGKQRLLAILDFIEGRVLVPAEWFPRDCLDPELPVRVGAEVSYLGLSAKGRRVWENTGAVATYWADFHGSDREERERELFDLINFGGVPQGEADPDA